MRVLAIDYGQKRLGLAMSDPLGITAQGLETYQRRSSQQDMAHIQQLVRQYGVDIIVLGWPRNMNGTEGSACRSVAAFALELEAQNLPVRLDYFDERLSSSMAERVLLDADISRKKRKSVIDKVAAVVILQSYLDARAFEIRRDLPWKKIESSN
ncbi:MAG: Holliday junction resolvase RuvX [Eubacteriales bacterium]|nr:Holliday junction resolvase RuvX [Eubacteriales bacterium]